MGSDISVQGWPFLYGRGEAVGAQVVVAPRSFSRGNVLSDIISAMNPAIVSDDPNKSYTLEYFLDEKPGRTLEFVVLFRVTTATTALIAARPPHSLLDTFRRPFPVVEGIVFRNGNDVPSGPASDAIWNAFEVHISPIYSQYWRAKKAMAVVFVDEPMTFHVDTTEDSVDMETISLEPRFIQEHLDWTSPS